MMRIRIRVIITVILVFSTTEIQAQQLMEIPRIEGSINIDGIPDEPAWQELEPLPMTTYLPEAGKTPSENSDVRIGQDGNYLYVGARLNYSDPSAIKATSYKRDYSGTNSDFFGILLDSHNNNETNLAFWVTPTGSRTDAVITDDAEGVFNFDWNEFWDAEIIQNGREWLVEMRIPFSSLRYQMKDNNVVMGLIIQRWIAQKSEAIIYPAIPNNFGFDGFFKPSQAAKIVFNDLEEQTPFRITPYLLGGFSQQQSLNNDQTAYNPENQFTYDAGLDMKYGFSSNLTLDLTLNTDFAQVEADNQQVNLTRFSLFFPEKRQFFQERASLFNFNFGENNRLFYSRQIGINQGDEVRILGGARLTGSVGDWDVGIINMQTAREQNIAPENFGVLRLRRKMFNEYSWGGGMFTSRLNPDGTNNYAMGLDGMFRLFDDTYLLANAAQTVDQGEAQTIADPASSRIRLQVERRNIRGFGYDLEFSRAGEAYNPGIGFELRNDFTKWGNGLFYGWFANEESPVLSYTVSVNSQTYQRNNDWSVETLNLNPELSVDFKSGSNFSVEASLFYEDILQEFLLPGDISIKPDSYTYFPVIESYYSTSTARDLVFELSTNLGKFYNGYRWAGAISPTYNISPKLNLGGYYEINRLDFPQQNNLYTTHLGRLRIEHFFSSHLSLNTFAQYSNVTNRAVLNFRIRYNPREGNDLYIVYNEGLNSHRNSFHPTLPISDNRTILLKYTYTFNY